MSEPREGNGDYSPGGPGRARRFVVLALIPALLIGAAALAGFLLRLPPGTMTGDEVPLRLLGIVRNDEPVLRDASGAKVSDVCLESWPFRDPDRDGQFFAAVFEPTGGIDGFVMWESDLHLAGERLGHRCRHSLVREGGLPAGAFMETFSAKRTIETYPWPRGMWQALEMLKRTVPVESANIRLHFYSGPRGECDYVFTGPFSLDGSLEDDDGRGGQAGFSRHFESGWSRDRIWCTKVRVTIPAPPSFRGTPWLLWYDTSGKRKGRAQYCGTEKVAKGEAHNYLLSDVDPEDVGAITINEKPREATIHNVRIAPPEDESAGPSYTERFAQIGVDFPSEIAPDDALKAAAVARGAHLRWCLHALLHDYRWLDTLTAEKREKLEALVEACQDNPDPAVRVTALSMGVRLDFAKYFDRAVEIVAEDFDPPSADVGRIGFGDGPEGERASAVSDLVYALSRKSAELSNDQVRRLAEAVLKADNLFGLHWGLWRAFTRAAQPQALGTKAARAALEAFARDERPWYWLRAFEDDRSIKYLGLVETWDRELKTKALIGTRFAANVLEHAADALPLADEMLENLLTRELNVRCPTGCARVIDAIADRLPPEKATEILARFALSTRDFSYGRTNFLYTVAWINRLNGVNISGLEIAREIRLMPGCLNPRRVQLDLERWLETGEVTPDVPEGYRARPGDLRVVCLIEGRDEEAFISLSSPALPRHAAGLYRRFNTTWGQLTYGITCHYGPPGQLDVKYDVDVRGIVNGKERHLGSDSGSDDFKADNLPIQINLRLHGREDLSGSLLIEPADSPESALSGTKVFEDWWKKYGTTADEDEQRQYDEPD
ncbi:MAG: hypothetical protein ACYTAN_13265 [Planctomycetota bacterium]|jgi:hypothetical protein